MKHTDPYRLRVLKALTECLEQITPANGYSIDLTGSVYRGRDVFDRHDKIPMVSILESIDEKEILQAPRAGGKVKTPWQLLVQGWAEDDKTHPTDPAQVMLAEVKRRLVEESRRNDGYDILGLGGTIDAMKFSTGVVRPADEVSAKAYFWLKLELSMIENVLDPYT